jgi:SNF2 family DNA or RNA helicase
MGRFFIDGNGLKLETEGSIFVPSAEQIYSSVVEGKTIWSDVPPGKGSLPDGLVVSRYPVVPKIIISSDSHSRIPITYIAYFLGSKNICKQSALSSGVDHFVCDGSWFPIDPNADTELQSLIAEYDLNIGETLGFRKFLELKAAAVESFPIINESDSTHINTFDFVPERRYSPAGIKAKLYGYQLDGWNWLSFLVSENIGCVLADEMGLGKTLQIISLLSDHNGAVLIPTLVVAPGSLLENWCREIKKFSSNITVLKHHGPHRTGDPSELKKYSVILTTYETLVGDSSLFLMVDWELVVLDEAQNIKNPHARRSKAVKELNRKVGIAVTGTPVENTLTDLWSIIDFAEPGYLGSLSEFEAVFENDVDGAEALEPLVSPIMLRRSVAEVATDLPIRINIPQAIELHPEEAAAYESIREKVLEEYGKSASLVELGKLRMFCCHPFLIDELTFDIPFSKFLRLDEILEEIFLSGRKSIVFCSFTRAADLIRDHVRRKYDVFCQCLDGRLAVNRRQSLIDEFSEVRDGAALVLNPKAGGTGLNITAANHVVHYNLEWNPALEDQASARAHRRGQEHPVTVHRLYAAGTIEEVISERLELKRELSQASVVGVKGKDGDYKDLLRALEISPVEGARLNEENF